MTSAKELLAREVDRLSEQDARELLEFLKRRSPPAPQLENPKLTLDDIRVRLAGVPGFRVPPADAPPFREVQPFDCPGIPASEMLIADRR